MIHWTSKQYKNRTLMFYNKAFSYKANKWWSALKTTRAALNYNALNIYSVFLSLKILLMKKYVINNNPQILKFPS